MDLVRINDPNLFRCLACVLLCPLIWNALARCEYYYRPLRKLTGSKKLTVVVIFLWVFSFSAYRDLVYHDMISSQPEHPVLNHAIVKGLGALCIGAGQVLVWSSMYRLGFFGTYLGDYCGILMDSRVTSFPFNVLDNPMYIGSSLSFLGSALWSASAIGVIVSAYVYLVYRLALLFEGPFTGMIYANRVESSR